MQTQTITVEAVNVKDKKTFTYKKGNKQGQQGFLYPIGLNVAGKWINGTAFSEEEADIFRKLNKGDKLIVILYEEEYQGKMYEKFKLPNDKDQLKASVDELTERIAKLENVIKSLVKTNKLIYTSEPAQTNLVVKEQPIVTANGNSTINPAPDDLPF